MFNFLKSLETSRSPRQGGTSKLVSQKQQISKISSYGFENIPYQIDVRKPSDKSPLGEKTLNIKSEPSYLSTPRKSGVTGGSNAMPSPVKPNIKTLRENAPSKAKNSKKEPFSGSLGLSEHPFQMPNNTKSPLAQQMENLLNISSSNKENSLNNSYLRSVETTCNNVSKKEKLDTTETTRIEERKLSNNEKQRTNEKNEVDSAKTNSQNDIGSSIKSNHYLIGQYNDCRGQKASVLSSSFDQTTMKSNASREEVMKNLSEKINILTAEMKGLEELNITLNSDVSYWSKAFENMRKKYSELVDQSTSLQQELEKIKPT